MAIKKAPLSYAIEPEHEDEIRNFVNDVNKKTGLRKRRIITDLIVDGISMQKKNSKKYKK